MNTTPEALIKEYADPIEQQEIDKFVQKWEDRFTDISKVCRVLKLPCSSLRNAWQV